MTVIAVVGVAVMDGVVVVVEVVVDGVEDDDVVVVFKAGS